MSYTNGLDKPTDYFNTKLYTGNGSTQSITGVGFQPDWVWIKERSSTSSHALFDAIRGATIKLSSNNTDADNTSTADLTSFDSDGFTNGDSGAVNESGQTYASWNWLGANGTASNTDGSITSTVSANTDRKSTRLNSSHGYISYAVFCVKKKKKKIKIKKQKIQ
mgnify:CR=1 FL=1